MKFINLLSDKIDYLFRRGKNGDERTFDFFIRTVTFLILALIILCYGSFVHADSSFPISVGVDISKLSGSWLFNTVDANNFCNEYYGENVVNPSYIPNYSHQWIENLPFDSSYDISSNYIIVFDCNSTNNSWVVVCTIPKNLISDGHVIFYCGDSCSWISDGNYSMSFYVVNQSYTIYETGTYNITSGLGSWNMGSDYYNKKTVFANFPLYCGDFSVNGYNTLVSNNFQDDVNNLYNMNYYTFPDLDLCSSAYISNGIGEVIPESVESNKNHMAFDNVQIGISSLKDGQNLDASSVIVGCSVDDWINNNIDFYSVKVTYTIGGKFRTLSPWTFDYNEVMPLKTFTNNVYVKSMHDIFVGMGYYNSNTYQGVNESYIINSDMSYNGGFPSLLNKTGNSIVKSIGTYRANKKDDNVQLILDDYYLNVDVVLIASDVQEPSGNFSKKFDFIRGNESILNSDGLQNSDPWNGEEKPQVDPYVPDVGSGNGMNQINNNNQTVNINLDNRFQNIVSGGANSDDYDDTIDNIKSLFGTFKESLAVMGDSTLDQNNNPNGFVGLLQSSYNFIPGMPYYILGIVVIVALCVLLFIIKALVF